MAQDMLTATLADMLRPETTRVARAFLSEYIAHWTPLRVERIACGGGSGGAGVANVCDGVRYCPNHAAADADDGVDLEALALVLGDRMAEAIAGPVAENSVIPGMVGALETADERAMQAIELATERERAVIRRLAGALSSVESTSREVRAALDAAAESLGPAAERTAARLETASTKCPHGLALGLCFEMPCYRNARKEIEARARLPKPSRRLATRFRPVDVAGFYRAELTCIVRAVAIVAGDHRPTRIEMRGPFVGCDPPTPEASFVAAGVCNLEGVFHLPPDTLVRLSEGEACHVKTTPGARCVYLAVEEVIP